jgi:hypothetical protein
MLTVINTVSMMLLTPSTTATLEVLRGRHVRMADMGGNWRYPNLITVKRIVGRRALRYERQGWINDCLPH